MSDDLIQINYRTTREIKDWLDNEAKQSGRSVQFMLNQAVMQWHRRLERDRRRRAERRKARIC